MHTHTLPPSIIELQKLDFYPDHLNSLTGFVHRMHELSMCELGMELAEKTAKGFLQSRSFEAETAMLPAPGAYMDFVRRWRKAVSTIHQKFGDRLPVQFYQVILFTGLRPDPHIEVKIPDVEHLLPGGMKWQEADGVEHALPLCTRLYLDIQTTVNRLTGRIMVHGCGCAKCAPVLPSDMSINVPMSNDPAVLLEETESVVRHFLTQLIPLKWDMPHSIGPSMTSEMIGLRSKQRENAKLTVV